jgi:D-beta-D-heptose 7-phosphate kinase/D-beta-D-heptose 1-phosphate adenosyltransferase
VLPQLQIVERFERLKALVVGDLILDTFLIGRPTRLCAEGPVPVLVKSAERHLPGGAANTAANLSALGARTTLVGLVGADQAGATLRASLEETGVGTSRLVDTPGRSSPHKVRLMAGRHYVARFDEEPGTSVAREVEERLLEQLGDGLADADVVVVSDYGCGTATPRVLELLRGFAERRSVPLVVDSKQLRRFREVRATAVTPNLDEASRLAGAPGESLDTWLQHAGQRLLRQLKAEWVVVTLGGEGLFAASREGRRLRLHGSPVRVADEVGAGDSLVAALSLGLAAGGDLQDAARLGLEASAVAVAKPETAVVRSEELRDRLAMLNASPDAQPARRLAARLAPERRAGKRLVFTNGVFDLLHEGHVAFLRRARELGDLLVVAVNSDLSSRRLKGKSRPINTESERAAVVSALDCVDEVVLFDDATAEELIRALQPEVYVKGDDHDPQTLPEAAAVREAGGEVVILPRVSRLSTSAIIDRVMAGMARPSSSLARG